MSVAPHQPSSVYFLYRTLIEKSTVDRLVLLVTVSQEDVQLHYGVQGGQTRSLSVKTAGHISIGQWTHVALQVGGLLLLSWSSGGHLYLSRVPFKRAWRSICDSVKLESNVGMRGFWYGKFQRYACDVLGYGCDKCICYQYTEQSVFILLNPYW